MTSLNGLAIIVALLASGISPTMAQSTVPSRYVLAPGVFIVRPGYAVAPGYVVLPPGYAVALAYFAPPGCNPSWYVGGYHRAVEACSHRITHTTNGY
jgi:hypothetical protein